MSDPGAILGKMSAVSDEQAENIQSSIDQVQAQIDTYNEEIDGVSNGLCNVISHDTTGTLTLYLDSTKLEEIELLYGDPGNTPFSVEYGPDYGKIDYTDGGVIDFAIIDVTANIMYEYLGTNWDNDPTIQNLIDEFDFGNDYLTRPLTSGASYGLIPNRDNLLSAKALLEQNKNKVEGSKTVFENYI